MPTTRVLLVDEGERNHSLVQMALARMEERPTVLVWENTYHGALAALLDRQFDVCLLSEQVGPKGGPELIAAARGLGCVVPIVFVTSSRSAGLTERALECGADDYIHVGDLGPVALDRRIRAACRNAEEASAPKGTGMVYRQLVGMIHEGVWIGDEHLKTRFVNKQMAASLGYECEELIGRSFADLVADARQAEAVREVLRDGVSAYMDLSLRRRGGSLLHTSVHVDVVRNADGEAQGEIGVVTDLSERDRAQGTIQTLEEKLRQAQKLEAIGSMTGTIAHDFNNVLSAILSYTHFLRDELKSDDALQEDVAAIHRAAQRAADLTRRLLVFSHQQALRPGLVKPSDVLESARPLLRRLLREDVELVIRPRAAGQVMLDASQIDQVLMNLTANAADAMPLGGTVTIETSDVELSEAEAAALEDVGAGSFVLLTFADTGAGIPADIRSRIFEPFFTTKPAGKGTGLGLASVLGVVRQGRGHISCESEPGRGTSFKIWLPRAAGAERPLEEVASGTFTVGGPATVLVAEDDDLVRKTLGEALRRAGFHVLLACDGDEALRAVERATASIDVLLTDVVMPKMSGHALAQRLKQARPGLAVLYISGYPEDALAEQGLLAPGQDLIRKPFTPEALVRKLRGMTGRAAAPEGTLVGAG